MNFKNVLAGFLSVAILSATSVTAFAATTGDLQITNDIASTEVSAKQSYFNSFTGTVKEIRDSESMKGSKFITVESEGGATSTIVVSSDTYVVNHAEIIVGSVITGFYDANAPMLMIYPPQYNAKVVAVENKEQNVKVDVFDKDLVSADHSLKLNINEDTKIALEDGTVYDGELANKTLVVIYGATTKSIPAQTNPSQIVVLQEKAVPPLQNVTEEEKAAAIGDISTKEIIVNNKKIEAPAAYMNNQGTVMVPLRAISEALGFAVTWSAESQSILLGNGISLTAGKDYYTYMKTSPIQLGTAPELVDGITFVPLRFFKEVTRMNNAYVFESQIVIDNETPMQ